MYLLIGTEADPCVAGVRRLLQREGDEALVTPEPLWGERRFSWTLDAERSVSRLRLGRTRLADTDWQGVLVRAAGPWECADWSEKDFAYLQAEAHAALLGWLGSLPCPVLNPARADVWFKPQRSLPEQRVLLARAGLATPPLLFTNEIEAARRFAAPFGGALSYLPITSSLLYPIDDEGQWAELERLMARMPVCLLEPRGERLWASYAGGTAVFSAPLEPRQRRLLEAGLERLADLLGVRLLQLELQLDEGEPQGLGFGLHLDLLRHDQAQQEELLSAIVATLKGLTA